MPDDNRVQGIAEKLDSGESEDSQDAQESKESSESHESQDSRAVRSSTSTPNEKAPAFTPAESEKTTVYGTESTISAYRRTISIATGSAEASGMEDVTAREVHNAILQLGIEDTDAIVEKIEEEREQ